MKMWGKLRASKPSSLFNQEKRNTTTRPTLNVNEEFSKALRTHSYTDFFNKADLHLHLHHQQIQASSPPPMKQPPPYPPLPTPQPPPSYTHLLLEPSQDTITTMLNHKCFAKKPRLCELVASYFTTSAEASDTCVVLLQSLAQARLDCRLLLHALHLPAEQSIPVLDALELFIHLPNPFDTIRDRLSAIHHHQATVHNILRRARRKLARRARLLAAGKQVAGWCAMLASGALAALALALAVHCFVGVVAGPLLLSGVPLLPKKKSRAKDMGLSGQLDTATKGAYILNADFDTVERLVARLIDEIEHEKGLIAFCLDRREERWALIEVVKQLRKSEWGFRQQAEELMEHLCLCLLTINRARMLVFREISAHLASHRG
ncbi:UPF0496 protein At1g20180 [Amborella trichopoda]|nr:UPF0496 protein At1g20180 [Amborella trichopoda]|eukprot:XP_020527388.1 UPF0496 protein At1g20180 [Amborella trichopoda]